MKLLTTPFQRRLKHPTKARGSLGIGYIGLAHYLARQGVKYNDKKALTKVLN